MATLTASSVGLGEGGDRGEIEELLGAHHKNLQQYTSHTSRTQCCGESWRTAKMENRRRWRQDMEMKDRG